MTRLAAHSLSALLAASLAGHASAQCPVPEDQLLFGSDGTARDEFGSAVDADGGVLMIGASRHPSIQDVGKVYVYNRVGGAWVESLSLSASDAGSNHRFGDSVAIQGSVAVVGASYAPGNQTGTGAAYVFRFDGSAWQEEQKLIGPGGQTGDNFGGAVDLDGDVILVGALADTSSGAVHVFRFDGSQWQHEQKLVLGAGNVGAYFGGAVALDGDRALIGASRATPSGLDSGSAFLYWHDGTSWVFEQELLPADGASFDSFGTGVALKGDLAVVGAYGHDAGGVDATGAVYVFRDMGTSWMEEVKLVGSDRQRAWLGLDVATDGEIILASTPGTTRGVARVYRDTGAGWTEACMLTAAGLASLSQYALDVALDGRTAIVGNWGDGATKDSGIALSTELPVLTLEVQPALVSVGGTLSFQACGGVPGAGNLLFVVDASGTPLFLRVAGGPFDASGIWPLSATVPPGLGGLQVMFLSIGARQPGKVTASNVRAVTIF